MNSDPFNGEAALAKLPHGAEFRFIDKLLCLNPGISGEGQYLIRGDESFLKGHFPGEPIFPGVILVEAGSQLAGIIAQNDPRIAPLRDVKLTAIRNVKILATAGPGQAIHLQSEISGRLGNLIQASIRAYCEGQLLMSGDITLSGDSD